MLVTNHVLGAFVALFRAMLASNLLLDKVDITTRATRNSRSGIPENTLFLKFLTRILDHFENSQKFHFFHDSVCFKVNFMTIIFRFR